MTAMPSKQDNFQAAYVVDASADCPILIVCEHASNHIPARFGNLGLSSAELESHIAWDPGAAEVAQYLSQLLNATCVLGGVSRLVYDCNRPPYAGDAMPERSENYTIPGNKNLSQADRDFRVENIYQPFCACLKRASADCRALITIHSFTPVYKGVQRDVELGILHDADTVLADYIISQSPRYTKHLVLRNEPYGPEHGVTHTLKLHGIDNGIPNAMIEIRNDLITTKQACFEMAEMLSGLIGEAVNAVLNADQALEMRK